MEPVTKNQINKAGKILKNPQSSEETREHGNKVLSYFRARHTYPMNTFQATLRGKLKKINNPKGLVAQRLKRAPSIIDKLKRFPNMALTKMQDIGGLRAVVSSIGKTYDLRDSYINANFNHIKVGEKDYIENPKNLGTEAFI